jgi:hypothetical protein
MRSPGPLLTLLTLLVATATASGQAEPPATWQEAVTCLEDASSVDTEATGFAGSKSSTWRAYEVLRDGAAAQQLEALTKHGDPVVRTYAVWALAERHPGPALVQVLRAHLEDREPVTFFQGCIMQESQVSEVMLEGSIRHLAEPELLDLTARLLWLGSDLPILRRLLRSDPFGPQALPRLRELAAAGDGNALIVLSHHARPGHAPRRTGGSRSRPGTQPWPPGVTMRHAPSSARLSDRRRASSRRPSGE